MQVGWLSVERVEEATPGLAMVVERCPLNRGAKEVRMVALECGWAPGEMMDEGWQNFDLRHAHRPSVLQTGAEKSGLKRQREMMGKEMVGVSKSREA